MIRAAGFAVLVAVHAAVGQTSQLYINLYDAVNDNYAVQQNGDYNVYRFDRPWRNPEVLCHVGFATSGITCDRADDTIWVTDSLSRLVRHLDRNGNLLSSFLADDGSYAYRIALDPIDGTLWLGGFRSNVIYQYDQNGTLPDASSWADRHADEPRPVDIRVGEMIEEVERIDVVADQQFARG